MDINNPKTVEEARGNIEITFESIQKKLDTVKNHWNNNRTENAQAESGQLKSFAEILEREFKSFHKKMGSFPN